MKKTKPKLIPYNAELADRIEKALMLLPDAVISFFYDNFDPVGNKLPYAPMDRMVLKDLTKAEYRAMASRLTAAYDAQAKRVREYARHERALRDAKLVQSCLAEGI